MHADAPRPPDWEAFYRDYRKPGYIAGFEITSKLGGGMFGLVFRARRMSIGKDYAIKFLQVDDAQVQKAVLGELEQVKYFAQIDHPNLVSIEDRGEVDGIPYVVMAFAGTETLRDKLPAGRLPTAAEKHELLRCFLQACRGLAALHERALVHFDIKPANVFLKGGVARLGDYGLSKLVTHSRGSLSMGRGTPYYMAPELLQRRGDHRSDIYSLGVLLYELLCGCVPFTGDSEWEVLKKHETAVAELPPHLTAREREVLQRCLHKDPEARFQSVNEVVAAFGFGAASAMSLGDLRTIELPDCVPPGLPAALPATGAATLVRGLPPPPLPRVAAAPGARRRVSGFALPLVLVLFGFALAFVWVADRQRAHASMASTAATVTMSAPRPAPMVAAGPASTRRAATARPPAWTAKVEQLLASIQRDVATVTQQQRRIELGQFDADDYSLPRDFRAYGEQIKAVGKSRAYPQAQARRIEKMGRPAFVAAVEALLDLDYDDADDCHRATNLHRLLSQMTGVSGLECAADATPGCEADVCRFLAVAEGWRRLADQYGKDDTTFALLLAAKGKAGTER